MSRDACPPLLPRAPRRTVGTGGAHPADRRARRSPRAHPAGPQRCLAASRAGSGGRGYRVVGADGGSAPFLRRQRCLPAPGCTQPYRRRGAHPGQRTDRPGQLLLRRRIRPALHPDGAASGAGGGGGRGLPDRRGFRDGTGGPRILARSVPLDPPGGGSAGPGRGPRAHARAVPGAGARGSRRDPGRTGAEGGALRAHHGALDHPDRCRATGGGTGPRVPEHLGVPPGGRGGCEPGDARADGGRPGVLPGAGRHPAGRRGRRAVRAGPTQLPR